MAGTGLLARMFRERVQRDGQATVLEAHATGIGPVLDALEVGALPGGIAGRRQRPLPLPHESVAESLAGKVLNAWLQNRHQTLYPLTVNLRTLDASRAALLARMMAFAMLAGGARASAERIEAALAWLGKAGGDDAVQHAFRAALDTPEPLSTLVRLIQDAGLTAYAYVVALVATDPRDDAGQLFLDYLATRLALPANVVRSADRRYRRQSSASVRAFRAP